ncbi:MAG: ROK family protein [Clostridia bacterium]|nr:ROK family protein [Clostridia bacterium]
MKFTGIDIGGTKCAVISGSAETGIRDKIKFATTNVGETIENIIKAVEQLGAGLSVLIDILNPEKIVIGSVFERSEELLRDKMERVINAETLSYAREVCEIVPAQLGDSIGDWAAIAVAENTLCG